ncbi:MAG: hypothetical protein O2904_02710 [bacterium]|nr:hypothetical protein [bacterium]
MSELSDDGGISDDSPASSPPPVRSSSGGGGGGGGGSYASELHSATIHARQRTFYIDLKESGHGKFFKLSEKSRGGQKTTIMFDAEDLDQFIQAFTEMKSHV